MDILLTNRHAQRDYIILHHLEAGIVLLGSEVKSLRQKRANITESFVRILHGEAYLVNANILPYLQSAPEHYDPTRSRKLLLKKKEVRELEEMLGTRGLTAVPLSIGVVHNYIKVHIGVGKGKKTYDRKRELQARDLARDTQKALKHAR